MSILICIYEEKTKKNRVYSYQEIAHTASDERYHFAPVLNTADSVALSGDIG